MTKIKHEAMVGMDTDMCNIPENIDHNYHIMVYRKDVSGEILNTIPSQPNLLITHKNSMYMSGYWDSSSSVLSWRLLNLGDGSDILTTTTTPKPTRYTIRGTFVVRLFNPQMVMIDLGGNEVPVTVEFTGVSGQIVSSYSGYVVTTTFNPVKYRLRVSGRDSMILNQANYWAGEITIPILANWAYDPNTATYSIERDFTSATLTTSTTTTAAPTTYEYTIQVNRTNIDMSHLEVVASNSQLPSLLVAGSKSRDGGWTFNWLNRVDVPSGWQFEFSGTSSAGRKSYSATLTNEEFVGGICTINNLILYMEAGFETNFPDVSIRPYSLDKPEDTNSLDDAINDYLNEQ